MTRVLTILGCGSSGGVPRVAQGWGACDPNNPRNRRRRCSVLVEQADGGGMTRLLVDTSPDLREQLLDADVNALDAILVTHPHADHTHGIDDLRPLYQATRKRLDIYMDAATSRLLRHNFSYVFATPAGSFYPPMLEERRIETATPFVVDGRGGPIEALPFAVGHGEIDALGFRFGGLAYTPDLNSIPDSSVPFLENLEVWIIDALRFAPHPSHFTVDEALGWIDRMRPARAVLTNLHTDLDYAALTARLPPHVAAAYDGLRIDGF